MNGIWAKRAQLIPKLEEKKKKNTSGHHIFQVITRNRRPSACLSFCATLFIRVRKVFQTISGEFPLGNLLGRYSRSEFQRVNAERHL